jgi:hypothetical protein
VSPVEALSGKTQRIRLNRGGDRQANSALYTIVLARLRRETRSRSYAGRRIAEGKTRREASRCLKNATSPESSTRSSSEPMPCLEARLWPLGIHRGIKTAASYEAAVSLASFLHCARSV